MELIITPKAMEELNKINVANKRYLLLWYDTVECGCGVNGMPTVRLINKKEEFMEVTNDLFPTMIKKEQKVFFAKNLKLDFINGSFRLSSPEGILNPFISPQSILVQI